MILIYINLFARFKYYISECYLEECVAPDDAGASPKNAYALVRATDSPFGPWASETGAQVAGTCPDQTFPRFAHTRRLGPGHIPSGL